MAILARWQHGDEQGLRSDTCERAAAAPMSKTAELQPPNQLLQATPRPCRGCVTSAAGQGGPRFQHQGLGRAVAVFCCLLLVLFLTGRRQAPATAAVLESLSPAGLERGPGSTSLGGCSWSGWVHDCSLPSSGVLVASGFAQFFLVLGVSYFLLLEYHSSSGIPMEGRVITPKAAQSSWQEKLLERREGRGNTSENHRLLQAGKDQTEPPPGP